MTPVGGDGNVLWIRVTGVKDTAGRFAKANENLLARRDDMLRDIATMVRDSLSVEAPRGAGGHGTPFADMFEVTSVVRDGSSTAHISIFNPKEVLSKAGVTYSLAVLILYGVRPHNIPGAFGFPTPFGVGGRFGGMFHPGMAPDDYVQRALQNSDVQRVARRFVQRVKVDVARRGTV